MSVCLYGNVKEHLGEIKEFSILEKKMATHSSILSWRIPWTEEPGGLQSTGLQRAGHDWETFAFFHFHHYLTMKGTKAESD